MSSPRPDTRLLHSETSPTFVTAAIRVSSNLTSILNADDGSDSVLFPGSTFTGNYMAFGADAPFNRLEIEITDAGVGVWTLTWQYYNGSTWVALSGVTDGTAGFTVLGVNTVAFDLPANMSTTTLGGLNKYYVRGFLTSFTSKTVNPRADYAKTYSIQDLGQYATTVDNGHEDPSARTALDGTGAGRSIEVEVVLVTTDTGTIVAHGFDVASPPPYRIHVDGSGDLFVQFDAASILDVAVPNIDGTPRTYIIAVNTEPNPTGATALRTEALVYDVAADELVYAVTTHSVYTVDEAGALAVGGLWNGAVMSDVFTGTINKLRISSRFHTRTEVREHWVADTAAPTVEGVTAVEGYLVPEDLCVAGALAGPQYQAAARAMSVGRNRHRLIGPVIQMLTPDPPVFGPDLTTTITAPRVRTLSDGYQTHLGWLWRRKIPLHTDWLRAAISWATWDSLAGAVSVGVRLYCSDLPPHLATEWQSVSLSRSTEDGVSGDGVREDFAQLRVARGGDGYSWLWLGLDAANANNRAVVRALTATPVSRLANGNQAPNQWG